MAEYTADLTFMKNFVSSIKRDNGWFCREDAVKFDREQKDKFKYLTYKYSGKKFYIKFKPLCYAYENKYLIRNMKLYDEDEIKSKYKNADDLVYEVNNPNPYGHNYYYCVDNSSQNSNNIRWLFSDNVKPLNPDLLKVYDYFVEKNILQ